MSVALLIGAGPGLSAAIARKLAARGHHVVLAARDPSDLGDLIDEIGGTAISCDAREPAQVTALFKRIDAMGGHLSVAIYNPSARTRGPVQKIAPEAVENALMVTAFGAFLMAHHAVPRMLEADGGTLLFTGASAGVKGFANSSAFAMGKFALRGLCQSLARELHPQSIHVGHVVVDGGIATTPQSGRSNIQDGPDAMLDPDALADIYMHLLDQHRSTWTWEIEARPWVEQF